MPGSVLWSAVRTLSPLAAVLVATLPAQEAFFPEGADRVVVPLRHLDRGRPGWLVGIDVEVVSVSPGPIITRFELDPAPGVKVSQISNLAKDLARSLSVIAVRVVEIIPGKSVMGLEIPNENRELVALSEIIQSKSFDQAASPSAWTARTW